MTLDEFRIEFLGSMLDLAPDPTARNASFADLVGVKLIEAEELTDFELCTFQGTGARKRRLKVDGYSYDELDNSISLVVVDFSGSPSISTFGATEANKFLGMLQGFLEEILTGSFSAGPQSQYEQVNGLAADLNGWKSNVSRYRLYLATDRQLSTRTKDWPQGVLNGVPVEFHIWDIERFYLAHLSTSGRDALNIDFTRFGGGIPCLRAGESKGEYQGYLCIVPGSTIADIFDQYGSRILEGNVRSYLSAKGKVNAGIQITIRNAPNMFFAYNNGITATAEHVSLESHKGALLLTGATNLQIVNGAQTTASLASVARKEGVDLSGIYVQMKLAVLPPEKAGQLVPAIAKFANSQNKVSDADFFSNHAFHVRLEEFSRRLWTPAVGGAQRGTHWFYERARGQYLNEQSKLTKSQRAQFQYQNPKLQVLTKTDIAKIENTRRGMPNKVSLGAQKNFVLFAEWIAKKWNEDETKFNEEYFKELVAYAILFRHVEKIVSAQPWYQGGYRANVVTYSLAKLEAMIAAQVPEMRLDLRDIWDRQDVHETQSQQLLIICEKVFDTLTDNSRPKENVTEWAKMEACWESVRSISIPLTQPFIEKLVSADEAKHFQKSAAEQQRTDNGIAIQTAVVSIAGKKWADIRAWGMKEGLLDSKEIEILRVASMIPARLPSEKQCNAIWNIRARLIQKGLPP